MMLGTIAAPARGGGAYIPAWLPAGATAFLDFTADHYFAGGAPRNLTDVLSGYDPAALSALGLYYDFNNLDNLPLAAGSLLSDIATGIAAGCTIVFDLDYGNAPYGFIMFMGDAPTDFDSDNVIDIVNNPSPWGSIYDDNDPGVGLGGGVTTTGVHKVAATLNRDAGAGNYEYAWSLDGAAATTQTVTYAPMWTLNTVGIGNDGTTNKLLDNVYLRSITLYPAKLPADLPALTDLPTA